MAYFRKTDSKTILVIANYQNEPQTLPLPSKVNKVILNTTSDVKYTDSQITLKGYQAVVLEL